MPQSPISLNARTPSGALAPSRLDQGGGLLIAPKLVAAALAGLLFTGTNVAAAAGTTTSVALATTYTGLVLSNPAASGKKLILHKVDAGLFVVPAAFTLLGLIAGYAAAGVTAHTTPLTPRNALINGAAPVAKLDAAATLVGTPYWAKFFAATPGATTGMFASVDIDGGIVIPEGGYVAIGSNIASPANALAASLVWEEVSV